MVLLDQLILMDEANLLLFTLSTYADCYWDVCLPRFCHGAHLAVASDILRSLPELYAALP